jgi:hypothetical protein
VTRTTGAILVAALTLLLYRSTLLPGLDFGDTPSFQVVAGTPVISPRDGYPLYFAIGRLFVWTFGGDRAHALNLASAVEAAAACGVIVLLAAELAGSLAAGLAAAWLFAGSYTFWSQAIIAEVYALHICLVALTLLLLLRWESRPTTARLLYFLAAYAFAFGNHLTMILLAPAYALFIIARSGRAAFGLRTISLSLACACAGALPYLWNLHTLWLAALPPHSFSDGLRTFWFDITKADWRQTMILSVPSSMTVDRLRMYLFDLTQQFGWVGPLLALVGIVGLARTSISRALLLLAVYLTTTLFALTYSVGDTHVFLLPSHLIVSLLAAPGIVFAATVQTSARWRSVVTAAAAIGLGIVATTRIYDAYPALDRSADDRPRQVLQELTAGVDDRHAILLTDLNWQIENGLNYFAKYTRPDVAVAKMNDVILYAPTLIADNRAINRQVVLTEHAAATLEAAYGPLFSIAHDDSTPPVAIASRARSLPPGTRFALCVLGPPRDGGIDEQDLRESLRILTGGRLSVLPSGDYAAVAGITGEPPTVAQAGPDPFRVDTRIGGVAVTIRMDAWLAFDTIRRMGFGHVIAGHRHTLIVERGISFVAFDAAGHPLQTAYAGGLFAPQPRYVVQRGP